MQTARILLLLSLVALPAKAVTIDVSGGFGSTGAPGVSGNPGADGGAGGVGGDADAVADEMALTNFARATGGFGGGGGAGGDGVSPGASGGHGGAGGAGGAASALAATDAVGSASASAQATGGMGGIGGSGGLGSIPGADGVPGAGGAGGAASATAAAHSASAKADASSVATGGNGGPGGYPLFFLDPNTTQGYGPSGTGGEAESFADASSDGAGAAARATATGGSGGYPNSGDPSSGSSASGGAARADASARGAGSQDVTAYAIATGGAGAGGLRGVIPAGNGGEASATAFASSTTGAAFASALQTGGAGGTGEGTASGDGASSTILDAVSGATAGKLSLRQTAVGGDGGALFSGPTPDGDGGNGGAATSELHASNPGGGALSAAVEARGGSGQAGTTSPQGGSGGDALASVFGPTGSLAGVSLTALAEGGVGVGAGAHGGAASALAAQEAPVAGALSVTAEADGGGSYTSSGGVAPAVGGDGEDGTASAYGTGLYGVTIRAIARGGSAEEGIAPGHAGTGRLGRVEGISLDAGTVDVTGEVYGGARQCDTCGGDAIVTDAISGATAGVIALRQRAFGGAGFSHGSADPVSGGAAESDLTSSQSAQFMELDVDATGGAGGRGGAATVHADGTNAGSTLGSVNTYGVTEVLANAQGGAGSPTGRGGDAMLTARGESSADSGVVSVGLSSDYGFGARGGNGGGAPGSVGGGDARSSSEGVFRPEGTNQVGSLSVFDRATGGDGLDGSATAGGAAWSFATGTSTGLVSTGVQSVATGGTGGSSSDPLTPGGDGGEAHASAHGSAALDDVSVQAFATGGGGGRSAGVGGRGADSLMANQVSADAFGVSLTQGAQGGDGGDGTESTGGNARSSLTNVESQGGRIFVAVVARGGNGKNDLGPIALGAKGGDASVGATAFDHTGAAIQIVAHAEGGDVLGEVDGSEATGGGTGGIASLEEVRGVSTAGGSVDVLGEVVGGGGEVAQSVSLYNAIAGDTTGDLRLSQSATGGDSVFSAGSADSRLSRSGSFRSLELEASASGGIGLVSHDFTERSAGGAARASVHAENSTGDVDATASATGGSGAVEFFSATGPGMAGAAADSYAEAVGHAAGHTVSAQGSAIGGSGGAVTSYGHGPFDGGAGGTARSETRALSTADAYVAASDLAWGGSGGGTDSPGGTAGPAGDAHSSAFAFGGGATPVYADARARGGLTSDVYGDVAPDVHQGNASALAVALGLESVSATSSAIGAGALAATSEAHATGTVLQVRSQAFLGPTLDGTIYELPKIDTAAEISVPGAITARYLQLERHGYAAGFALPNDYDTSVWFGGNPNAQAAIAAGDRPLAVGYVGGGSQLGVRGDVELELDASRLSSSSGLTLAFLDSFTNGAGIDLLHLELTGNGLVLFDRSFHDTASAQGALSDSLYDLGGSGLFDAGIVDFVLSYELSSVGYVDGFLTEFALLAKTVPEPSLLSLFAAAALLALTRR